MSTEQLVAYALECPTVSESDATGLTPRELEVVRLLGRELTNRQIAECLVVSQRTVKRHVENILMKLDLRSRMQVADWATQRGVLTVD